VKRDHRLTTLDGLELGPLRRHAFTFEAWLRLAAIVGMLAMVTLVGMQVGRAIERNGVWRVAEVRR
jgi:hypothetical protein